MKKINMINPMGLTLEFDAPTRITDEEELFFLELLDKERRGVITNDEEGFLNGFKTARKMEEEELDDFLAEFTMV